MKLGTIDHHPVVRVIRGLLTLRSPQDDAIIKDNYNFWTEKRGFWLKRKPVPNLPTSANLVSSQFLMSS